MDIYLQLIEFRKQKNITIVKMSSLIDHSYDALCRYERGDAKVPWSVIKSYAEYLGFDLKLQVK